jgi:sigma-B regulation protein RsbU (phosphoserine phosphatase)
MACDRSASEFDPLAVMHKDSKHDRKPSRAPGTRPCVLVVDDDEGSRKLVARVLESVGFDARLAADGDEALASISEEAPDVVLLDLQMPGLNGTDTCRALRAHKEPAIRELPVIMLTAQDDEAAEVRCLESGANDFLAKPVGRAALTARIQTQLRLRALTLELRTQNQELERWRASQLADLEAARLTQTAIIPSRPPTIPGWKLEIHFEPLIQVGGDVYGWRVLGDGRCIVWIADATGHGAAAALVTTMVAHLFQQATHSTDKPHQILREVNTEFFSLFRGKSFMSAFCALLSPDGSIAFSSAGHPPMLVARTSGSVESFMADATMIGLAPNLDAAGSATRLRTGEHLLTFTDGLHSLRLPSGERMTWQESAQAVASIDRQSSFLPSVLQRIKVLGAEGPFDDDVTAISAGYHV